MTKPRKTRVEGYTMHRKGKTIKVRGYLRKKPKRR